MIRVKTRNDFLPIYMAGQTNDYTEHVLSMQLPSEASRFITSSLTQNVLYTSISLSVSEPLVHVGSLTVSCLQGSHMYVLSLFISSC